MNEIMKPETRQTLRELLAAYNGNPMQDLDLHHWDVVDDYPTLFDVSLKDFSPAGLAKFADVLDAEVKRVRTESSGWISVYISGVDASRVEQLCYAHSGNISDSDYKRLFTMDDGEKQTPRELLAENIANSEYTGLLNVVNAEKTLSPMRKPRLFVDMDGTLSVFPSNDVTYLERMYEPGFFRNLEPYQNAVNAVKRLCDGNKLEVYVLSSVINSPTVVAEKNAWLDEHLPEIGAERRLFCQIDEVKSMVVPAGVHKTDILWDDYNKNLTEWQNEGGTAVKCKNGFNHKGLHGELWTGTVINNQATNADLLIQSSVNKIVLAETAAVLQPGIKFMNGTSNYTVIGWSDIDKIVCLRDDGWKCTALNPTFKTDGRVEWDSSSGGHFLQDVEKLEEIPGAEYHVEEKSDLFGKKIYIVMDKNSEPLLDVCGEASWFDRYNESRAILCCHSINEKIMKIMNIYYDNLPTAVAKGEKALWNISAEQNIACCAKIEAQIRAAQNGYSCDTKAALEKSIAAFGEERVLLVTANEVLNRASVNDGRISPQNVSWAKSVRMPETRDDEFLLEYYNSSPGEVERCRQFDRNAVCGIMNGLHSCLLDGFATRACEYDAMKQFKAEHVTGSYKEAVIMPIRNAGERKALEGIEIGNIKIEYSPLLEKSFAIFEKKDEGQIKQSLSGGAVQSGNRR